MLPKIPTNTKELEEGFNDLKRDVVNETGKAVTTVGKDVSGQVALTDFVKEMYAPSAKGAESGSGETASVGEQLTPKPGELFGNIAGSPLEPGQQDQTESALGQVSLPVDKLAGTMVGMPMDAGESGQSEDPLDQLLPTANQVGTWASGSTTTQRVTPHMETAGQQIIPSFDELAGQVGITPSETPTIPGQHQAPAVEQSPELTGPGQSAAGAQESIPGESQAASQVEQKAQQQADLNTAGIDANMQMTAEERSKLSQQQKEERERRMLHEYEYFTFKPEQGGFDVIGTLREQVNWWKQKRKQEDEQRKQEEEERETQVKQLQAATGASHEECSNALDSAGGDYDKALEMLQQKQLPESGGKPKQGEPVSVDQAKKKTEVHRGAAG